MNPCTVAVPKDDEFGDDRWMSMHNRYVIEAKSCEPDVVWIGDSIIQQLQFSDLWNTDISALHCLNFGIGGDRVEHVLWRLENGELDFTNCTVKAIVLFVGTNNINCTAQQIFDGIEKCVQVIRQRLGEDSCHILLPTLLPRGQYPNKLRKRNSEVNELLKKKYICENDDVDPRKNVHVIEIDKNIVQGDGTISHYLLHDYLHLTNSGYTKIFTPVYEKLCDLLKK